MKQEYAIKLRNSSFIDKKIILPGSNADEIKEIGDELRRDLLSLNVPHWKVIGVVINPGMGSALKNYIEKVSKVSVSLAEFVSTVSELIYADRGGCAPELQQLYYSNKDVEGYVKEYSYLASNSKIVITNKGSLFFSGKIADSGDVFPESLVCDKEILRFETNDGIVNMLLHRGTGYVDFVEAGILVRELFDSVSAITGTTIWKSNNYVPVSEYYDLTDIFSVKMYEDGDEGIYLRLKKKINMSVLEKIIKDYAADFIEREVYNGED